MKYIRLHDKIEEVLEEHQFGKSKSFETFYGNSYAQVDVIAQADTIEELCDVYIVEKFKHIFTIDEISKNIVRNCKKSKVYGAIWTDKGLIYVAKLNDKGELELL